MHRPLHDKTQQTDIHTPGGIQTRNPREQAATDPHLRMCGQWDQENINLLNENLNVTDNTNYWVPLRTFIETKVTELKNTFTSPPELSSHLQSDPNTAQ